MGATEPVKIVFMGTPHLGASVLEALLEWEGCEVLAAYCQPDKPAGRGMSLRKPPVKELAEARGIPVRQPRTFKNPEDVALLRALAPDYLAIAAYGLILPQSVLDVPAKMPLNVHTSLLPKYRGAAPIQRAVMNGDTETGVTIMRVERELDAGPIILLERVPVLFTDTAADLHDRLAAMGGKTLIKAIRGLEAGELSPVPQKHENASYAAKLTKSEGALDFSRTGEEIYNRMRGVMPWPGAYAVLRREGEADIQVGILAAAFAKGEPFGPPGRIAPVLERGSLAVSCADGVYLVTELKPAGKKAMDAAAFMNGYLRGRAAPFFAPPV